MIRFFLQSLKLKGGLRKKYLYIVLGSIAFLSGAFMYIYTLTPLIIFVIIMAFSVPFINIGVIPSKTHKPKKKTVSREMIKFASYLTGKSKRTDLTNGMVINENNFKNEILIFMSYATIDADLFKVKDIAELLTKTKEIQDVLYWQEDMEDNIFEYMNDNLGKCHAMILFCSKAALESTPVKKEWTAAEAAGLPIIPVFYDVNHIPTLLKSRLGIEFDFYDVDKNVAELQSLILKKCGDLTGK